MSQVCQMKDLTVGATGPVRSFGPVTQTDIVRYAGASGDFNPLHHDNEYAQAAGFPGVFSIGMLQAGFVGTYLSEWLGLAGLGRFSIRFLEQVWPGDVLTCRGSVSSSKVREQVLRLGVEVVCTRQTGGPAVTGSAMFRRPTR